MRKLLLLTLVLTFLTTAAAIPIYLYFAKSPGMVPPFASLKHFTVTINVPPPLLSAMNWEGSNFNVLTVYENPPYGFQLIGSGGAGLPIVPKKTRYKKFENSKWITTLKFSLPDSVKPGEKMEFSLDRKFLETLPLEKSGKREAWFNFNFCEKSADPYVCRQFLSGVLFVSLDSATIDSLEPTNLGNVTIARHYRDLPLLYGTPNCAQQKIALSGKVIPTKAFLTQVPKDWIFALVALPEPFTLTVNTIPVQSGPPPYYVTYIPIQPEGAEFSFPMNPALGNNTKDFSLFAVACPPHVTAADCVNPKLVSLFPLKSSYTETMEIFPVIPKALNVPLCGDEHLTFYLHYFPAKVPPTRDPTLPPEIIEDGLYL